MVLAVLRTKSLGISQLDPFQVTELGKKVHLYCTKLSSVLMHGALVRVQMESHKLKSMFTFLVQHLSSVRAVVRSVLLQQEGICFTAFPEERLSSASVSFFKLYWAKK